MTERMVGDGPNPGGLCMCGCGQMAPLAKVSRRGRGDIRGRPVRYIRGHQRRLSPVAHIVDEQTGCWVWQLGVSGRYGTVRAGAIHRPAHVVYWEREHGSVPEGLELDHLCHNTRCVNPDHLEAVTHAENCRRGAHTKLTVASVADIRSRCATRESSRRVLSAQYGVSLSCLDAIVSRRTWPPL